MVDHGSIYSWFAHPVYGHYWQHYQQAMNWHQRHRQAYRKAWEAAYGPGYPQQYPNAPQRYADWHGGESGGRRAEETVAAKDHEEEDLEGGTDDEEGDGESGSDSEIECDVSNMEITEELRQYFAQTERHKEELKKQQQLEAEQQDSYVLADQDMHRISWHGRLLPPSERPGERRGAEMKKLYGEDAAKIQGMETAMQLTFDRNCDKKQPKYWPVIPLKL
ncbi:gem-associated protein 8-like [Salvelinus fontinalis]|uniref:gem-associated protein 8-like n=1 Tax=Salvelinus fontinalis TaxID=8038 RepID=UPI0024854E34|nr:gem-associated protein 8-like [Salvelinus fontinalis]